MTGQARRDRAPAKPVYLIDADADGPPLRRTATLMDAMALALGQASAVGRLLAVWSARILVAAAQAQQRAGAL